MTNKHKLIGDALAELVEQARTGGPRVRVGIMSAGSELGAEELLQGAVLAMRQDVGLQVVAIGEMISGYDDLEWIETNNSEEEISDAMELALDNDLISGAVALHYPFPLGVTTIGRVLTPAKGKPLLIASSTGMSAISRTEAMLRNAVLGIAVAKSLGFYRPSIGILNLDGAVLIQHALSSLSENGYDINFGNSIRADGGILLRGNDLLAGTVDICVCDTLTGNVLMKLLSAFNTGGGYEAIGWGYGPSVGENWEKIVSIISRTSGAPVIANALCYTASLIRGDLVHNVKKELKAAKAAGLDEIILSLTTETEHAEKISMPAQVPTDSEINGVDVLSLENAVKELWKVGIYAESGMGCTGPVIKIPGSLMEQSTEILKKAGYI
jgi:hypothetical protein